MPPPTTNRDLITSLSETEAKKVLKEFFNRIGYDIEVFTDVQRLQEDLRWAAKRRESEAYKGASLSRFAWTIAATVVGAILSFAVQWVKDHWPWPGAH